MREHQIVITLKPEQFSRIQQLAKESGAPSIGAFAREKLLSALETGAASGKLPSGAPVSARTVVELKRIQTELKGFVAESLTNFRDSQGTISERSPSKGGARPAASDELEQLADRTFAISPRLGTVHDEAEDSRDPLADLLAEVKVETGKKDDTGASIDDDESVHIPLSIKERMRQMALEAPQAENSKPDPLITAKDEPEKKTPSPSVKPAQAASEAVSDVKSSFEERSPQKPAPERLDEKTSTDPTPPISGSPPPKRKKT